MNRLHYSRPADYWEESLPLGNGSLGAMIFGRTGRDSVPLNHDTLWSGHPVRESRPGTQDCYRRAGDLVLKGEYAAAQDELFKGFISNWTQCYLPLGELMTDIADYGLEGDYDRGLNLETGVATCEYTGKNGVHYKREYFCSHPDDVLVCRLTADKSASLTGSVRLLTQLRYTNGRDENTLWMDGECPYDSNRHEEYYPQHLHYSDKPDEHGVRFRCAVRVLNRGGELVNYPYSTGFDGCDEVLILLAVQTSFIDFDHAPDAEYRESCLEKLNRACKPFETLLDAHVRDHAGLFDRLSIRIGSEDRDELPTDERLNRLAAGEPDEGLYTLLFQYGRYLTIAGSRPGSQAMNLQGIWNKQLFAPWRGNYTVNINTEMNYWPTLPANLEECHEPLIHLIRNISETGRDTARSFYGAPGWVCHHNTDLWAHTVPVLGNPCWSIWHGASGWLSRSIWEQWLYTGDRDFLRENYPILKGAAEFYNAMLRETNEGTLALIPATSPENEFLMDGRSLAVGAWSSMSQAIMTELFRNVIEAAGILGCDKDFADELTEKLGRIQDFKVGSKGQLLEWNEEFVEAEPDHRHTSHLYGLHPSRLFADRPELLAAAKRSLELRGDDGTGWSLGWKINHWARLHDGDHALKLIQMQLRPVDPSEGVYHHGGTFPNLFDAHPPFQIDGNFGFTSGICEMLVQWTPGRLMLLPALPTAWQEGEIRGLRAPGNLTIDMAWSGGRLTVLKIDGNTDGLEITVRGQPYTL